VKGIVAGAGARGTGPVSSVGIDEVVRMDANDLQLSGRDVNFALMKRSEATVRTAHASRYLQQLAKHWGHKFPVEFTPTEASIVLPAGRCQLTASADQLLVELTGADEADMDRFQAVVAEHIQRFGHRETLAFDWQAT
jgi:hypothetical protein